MAIGMRHEAIGMRHEAIGNWHEDEHEDEGMRHEAWGMRMTVWKTKERVRQRTTPVKKAEKTSLSLAMKKYQFISGNKNYISLIMKRCMSLSLVPILLSNLLS